MVFIFESGLTSFSALNWKDVKGSYSLARQKNKNWTDFQKLFDINPLASEASREVANLAGRKNPHTPYMASKNLSV